MNSVRNERITDHVNLYPYQHARPYVELSFDLTQSLIVKLHYLDHFKAKFVSKFFTALFMSKKRYLAIGRE